MKDTTPQTASGKVLMHFTMSLDGFVAGPGHSMDWMMAGTTNRPGLLEEYVETTGAVLGGRDGWDLAPHGRPYSDEWEGAIFVLTHHPEDAPQVDGVTVLSCDVAEAVRIGLEAAERQEPRGPLPDDRPPAPRARTRRRDRPAHLARSSSVTGSGSSTTPAARRSGSSWATATTRWPK